MLAPRVRARLRRDFDVPLLRDVVVLDDHRRLRSVEHELLAPVLLLLLRLAPLRLEQRESEIEAARNAFYRGFVAEAIDRFVRGTEALDQSGERHRGVLDADDMGAWQASYEPPVTYDYHGMTVAKTGPWGQGPAFLQTLALLHDAGGQPAEVLAVGGEYMRLGGLEPAAIEVYARALDTAGRSREARRLERLLKELEKPVAHK